MSDNPPEKTVGELLLEKNPGMNMRGFSEQYSMTPSRIIVLLNRMIAGVIGCCGAHEGGICKGNAAENLACLHGSESLILGNVAVPAQQRLRELIGIAEALGEPVGRIARLRQERSVHMNRVFSKANEVLQQDGGDSADCYRFPPVYHADPTIDFTETEARAERFQNAADQTARQTWERRPFSREGTHAIDPGAENPRHSLRVILQSQEEIAAMFLPFAEEAAAAFARIRDKGRKAS